MFYRRKLSGLGALYHNCGYGSNAVSGADGKNEFCGKKVLTKGGAGSILIKLLRREAARVEKDWKETKKVLDKQEAT